MNPALKQLGFDARDRVLIIHADDIGMCQATLPAIAIIWISAMGNEGKSAPEKRSLTTSAR